jgi:hypothetical protein
MAIESKFVNNILAPLAALSSNLCIVPWQPGLSHLHHGLRQLSCQSPQFLLSFSLVVSDHWSAHHVSCGSQFQDHQQ